MILKMAVLFTSDQVIKNQATNSKLDGLEVELILINFKQW